LQRNDGFILPFSNARALIGGNLRNLTREEFRLQEMRFTHGMSEDSETPRYKHILMFNTDASPLNRVSAVKVGAIKHRIHSKS